VDNGTHLRVSGKGDAGEKGAPPGDLYVLVHVKPHPVFERHNSDILMVMPITYPQAVLGDEVEVPTLNGRLKLKIPPGTQTGTVFRMRGKGIKRLHGHGAGDHNVKVTIKVPDKLSHEEKILVERLKEIEKVEEKKEGVFSRWKSR
jgi:molecular chaperone DnaJ